MKKLDIKQLDEKDEEIAGTLISFGMSRPVARILSYLQNVNEATSVELEMRTETSISNRGYCVGGSTLMLRFSKVCGP